MKFKTSKFLMLTLICFLIVSTISTNSLQAQDDTPMYVATSYMKVKAENIQEYKKLEKVWKKIHEARIKKGTLTNWAMYEVAVPYGTGTEYNFATVNMYKGRKLLAGHYEGGMMNDIAKMLTPEEMKLVEKTNDLRDMVKEEVYRTRSWTKSKVQVPSKCIVVNFMKSKEGYRGRDIGEVENKYWKPLHQSRVDKGQMDDWTLYSLELPYGKSIEHNTVSVDFYKGMEQYLAPWYDEKEVKKIHPNITFDEILKKTNQVRDLIKADVWMLVDYTNVPTTTATATGSINSNNKE